MPTFPHDFPGAHADHGLQLGGAGIHILHCPNCDTGSKCVTFIAGKYGMTGIVLTKYSSCECPLSSTQRVRLIHEAKLESGVL